MEGLRELINKKVSQEEVIKIIADLVGIPSHPGIVDQETKVAECINKFFLREGIESQVIPLAHGRSNIVATLRGKGKGKKLLLTGHMDTVPPYDMEGDPYYLNIIDGKMFGRGVVDMKGALACMMAAMMAIKRSGIELEGDIIFAAVAGEEDKSEGTRFLIDKGLKADAAIVGEPTELDICVGHRGLEWFEFNFHGKTVHGGKQKEGINAISQAFKFIERLERELIPKIEGRTHQIIGQSSMNYGLIKGGTQPSTVPGDCTLQIDRRWIPGEKYEDIVSEYEDIITTLEREDPQFRATFKVMDVSYMEKAYVHEAMEIDVNHPIVKIAQDSVRKATGVSPRLTSFTAWTDGGLLSNYGNIPTIVLGPGNLEYAHSAGEYLEISQIMPAVLSYISIALSYCN